MSSTASHDWVEQLRALAEASDPGPWMVDGADDDMAMSATFVVRGRYKPGHWPDAEQVVAITLLQSPNLALADLDERNAKFIAAARDGVPRLCTEVQQLTSQRDRLAEVLRRVVSTVDSKVPGKIEVTRKTIDEARALLSAMDKS